MVWICIGVLVAACSSKAKRSQEAREAIERMNQEHEALARKESEKASALDTENHVERTDGIAARVNEEVILLSDVEDAAPDVFSRIRSQVPESDVGSHMQDARRVVLNRLIERRLLEQEAEKRKVRITDEELQLSLDNLIQQRGLTLEGFYIELAREKKSIEQFKEKLRNELMVYRLLDVEINRHIHITDEQCAAYYQEHREDYVTPGEGIHIQQIVMITRGDRPEEKEEKRRSMDELWERLSDGQEFGKLAREFSEGPNAERGGDCGFFKKGELMEELDEAVVDIEVGELTPVIETTVGLHILKLLEEGTGTGRPLESVKEEIRAHLSQKAYADELKKLLDSLKASAYIDIRL
jgi:peptidyl-prolyl cis-trans isomerase SurA